MSRCTLHSFALGLVVAALAGSVLHAQGVSWNQEDLERVAAEIKAEIEEMRGARFTKPIVVKLASKAEFLEHAKQRLADFMPPEKTSADEMVAKMLGLIPPDMDLQTTSLKMLEEQVGGFYSPATKSFYLMEGSPAGMAGTILAHELGHALDDQLHDFDRGLAARLGNGDAMLAYGAVIEGSGTALMNAWTIEHMADLDLAGMAEMQKDANRTMADVPMLIWKPLLAAYLAGSAFLTRSGSMLLAATKRAENADVERAFMDPPRSTEQVLHPDKYWKEEARDEPRAIEHEAKRLPSGWQELRRDVFGELMLAILTTPPELRAAPNFDDPMAMMMLEFKRESAAGWGGDALILLGKDGARALELVTLWDSERDAGEFHGAMSMLLPALESALAKLAAGSGEDVYVELDFGERRDEVVLGLGFGAKSSELKKVLRRLEHREVAAVPR